MGEIFSGLYEGNPYVKGIIFLPVCMCSRKMSYFLRPFYWICSFSPLSFRYHLSSMASLAYMHTDINLVLNDWMCEYVCLFCSLIKIWNYSLETYIVHCPSLFCFLTSITVHGVCNNILSTYMKYLSSTHIFIDSGMHVMVLCMHDLVSIPIVSVPNAS